MRTKIGKALWAIVVFFTIGVSSAWADGYVTVNNLEYMYYTKGEKTGTAEVVGRGATWYGPSFKIESSIVVNGEHYRVTSIANRAFENANYLTSITIPNSITSIGYLAFESCSRLTSVTIPNSVTTIGERAFLSCVALTNITIPASVTSIGHIAFGGCKALKSFTVADKNVYYSVQDGILFNKSKTELIYAVLPINGGYTIPNSVTTIGKEAFADYEALTSITIPNSVTTIGEGAFNGCTGLTHVTIPNSVTTIGRLAFIECSGLISVTIPNSVTTIGEYAFGRCRALSSITIPNSVTTIGYYAFEYCSRLTSIAIPNSVKYIGEEAFIGCSDLKDLYVDINYPLSNYSNHFRECDGLNTIYVRKKSDYSEEELNSVPTGIEIVELAVADYPYNKEGYATMCSRYPFVLPRGSKAGVVVGTDGDALLVDYAYKAGDILPEATPVLIKGRASEAGGRMEMVYPDSYEGMKRTSLNNLLKGVYADTEVEGNDAYSHYMLGYDANGANVGFYWVNEFTEGYGIPNVPANRCYLEVPYEEDIPNRFLLEKAEDVTAIKDIDGEESAISDAPIFDLIGRKVASPAKGSIYVRNGKKFVAQ